MKKLAWIFTLLLSVGCGADISYEPLPVRPHRTFADDAGNVISIKVFLIDGCEYLSFFNSITHKGDCANPIHVSL